MTQYLACKFRPADTRTYTYQWDGAEPFAVGDKVTVRGPRDEGNMTVEYNSTTGQSSWNRDGAVAVILI